MLVESNAFTRALQERSKTFEHERPGFVRLLLPLRASQAIQRMQFHLIRFHHDPCVGRSLLTFFTVQATQHRKIAPVASEVLPPVRTVPSVLPPGPAIQRHPRIT